MLKSLTVLHFTVLQESLFHLKTPFDDNKIKFEYSNTIFRMRKTEWKWKKFKKEAVISISILGLKIVASKRTESTVSAKVWCTHNYGTYMSTVILLNADEVQLMDISLSVTDYAVSDH